MVKVTLKCDRCGKEETFSAKHSDICNHVVLGFTGWTQSCPSDCCHDGICECEDLCPDCAQDDFLKYAESHPEEFSADI